MKVCNTCHTEKPLDRFEQFKGINGKMYHQGYCFECYRKKRDAREIKKYGSEEAMLEHRRLKARKTNVKKRYGLEWDEYLQMMEDHNNKCAICRCDLTSVNYSLKACVDHCHDTGKVRGILCNNCNSAIGLLKDDPDIVKSAMEYLIRYKDCAE